MLPSSYEHQNCPIASGLEILGERWTLLITRDAFLGVRRFDDFQSSLGMSRTVLARRLDALVDAGLLRREAYQRRPVRYDYVATEKALALWPAVVGFAQWGGEHASAHGTPREFLHDACGTVVRAEVRCPHCDVAIAADAAGSRPGPGHRAHDGELADALSHPRRLLEPLR
jgi:DNA-binding HxlR family transcriptional regulator